MTRILLASAAASCLLLAPFSAGAQTNPGDATATPPEVPAQTVPAVPPAEPSAAPAEAPGQQSQTPSAPIAEPSAAPAIPAQQTASACTPRSATVFFDSNSDDLNVESQQAVATTAEGASACSIQSVVLAAYADARGDAEYNRALSERRAETVRSVLIAQGVPADAIQISAQGEANASGDAAQDRRVEVQMQLASAETRAEPAGSATSGTANINPGPALPSATPPADPTPDQTAPNGSSPLNPG